METVQNEVDKLFNDFAARNGVRHMALAGWRNLLVKAFLGKEYFLAAQYQKIKNKKAAKTCRIAARIDRMGLPIVDDHFIGFLFPGQMMPPELDARFSFETIGQLAEKLPYEWEGEEESPAFRKFVEHVLLMAKYDRVYR